jgi:hypothetical protein
MIHVIEDASWHEKIETLKTIFREGHPDASPPMIDAMQSMITAFEYKDQSLMESAFHSAMKVLHENLQNRVNRILQIPGAMRKAMAELSKMVAVQPPEKRLELMRDLKNDLIQNGYFSTNTNELTDKLKQRIKFLGDRGYPIENADQIDQITQEIQKLKQLALESWPSGDRPVPPLDRDMMARSKEAFERGEALSIEEVTVTVS